MSEFIKHNVETAPAASKGLLQGVKNELGFIPELMSAFAESPASLEAYLNMAKLFDKTSFSAAERQVILLSISRYRNCTYCLAAHGTLAKMQKIPASVINAVYYNQPLKNEKLEALRSFTRAVLEADGWADQDSLKNFYRAGYGKQQVLEVVLGISFKTLSNYVNHINDTPIDTQFLSGLPDNGLDRNKQPVAAISA